MANRPSREPEWIDTSDQIPIAGRYDVIVVGGGIAGVSAALAARRNGADVLIIENGICLGGLATQGLVAYFLPLCDGMGRKIVGGIPEELLHLSIRYGYDTLPPQWRNTIDQGKTTERYQTEFSPPAFVLALDELLMREKVDLLLETRFCKPVMEDEYCKAILVENKSGRHAFVAPVYVDATGDAELMCKAGADCVEGKNWLTLWYYSFNPGRRKRTDKDRRACPAVRLSSLGARDDGSNAPKGFGEYRGTSATDITRFVLDGRKLLRQKMEETHQSDCIVALPSMAQLRTVRRISGYYELKTEDQFRVFDDSIGCIGHFKKTGIVYEIPFRSLTTDKVQNVVAAGRCISAKDDAWEISRVIPGASLTGQAAGTAAALAVEKQGILREIDIGGVQKAVQETGIRIHVENGK